ncbi:2-succinyl-6-hydroxy-2,4-cyclohexadiene-1-carboxylate synthase [Dickeya aquatica]|uniref:2-succinyl-6-hydroxy-2,4-cyclohexadiene-1-carboxylate synthase n=2 Tax=Pectobacteriaceae TaxID=1903410 RepID=A0A375ACV8_9GAMM|nr:2-succinyl-6-hydroxy-2,4-cyclohexadiene-1-carboxylate synthase [Dickeya aquatica]
MLHGLLGSAKDWQPVLPYLADWPLLLIDLPGHGSAWQCGAQGFAQISQQLSAQLAAWSIDKYWLLGYSLGGRLAMYHACYGDVSGLQGLLVEGGHPGLEDEPERLARRQHDTGWATRFRQPPLEPVLADWYQQPVFAALSPHQRERLVALRAENDGVAVAAMLEATSLAHQPYLVPLLRRLAVPLGYLCGHQDTKFQALAARHRFTLLDIACAGHNAHQANPSAYAARIRQFISYPERKIDYALSQ